MFMGKWISSKVYVAEVSEETHCEAIAPLRGLPHLQRVGSVHDCTACSGFHVNFKLPSWFPHFCVLGFNILCALFWPDLLPTEHSCVVAQGSSATDEVFPRSAPRAPRPSTCEPRAVPAYEVSFANYPT